MSVGGTTITLAQFTAIGTTPVSIATTHGTLVIDGYNGTTGAVGYTFTLTAAADHSGGAVNETIALVLTDSDGDTAPATLAFVIVDDAPSRRQRLRTALTEDTVTAATGNVVTSNDIVGADADATPVSGVVAGTGTPLSGNVGIGDQRQLRHADAQRQRQRTATPSTPPTRRSTACRPATRR